MRPRYDQLSCSRELRERRSPLRKLTARSQAGNSPGPGGLPGQGRGGFLLGRITAEGDPDRDVTRNRGFSGFVLITGVVVGIQNWQNYPRPTVPVVNRWACAPGKVCSKPRVDDRGVHHPRQVIGTRGTRVDAVVPPVGVRGVEGHGRAHTSASARFAPTAAPRRARRAVERGARAAASAGGTAPWRAASQSELTSTTGGTPAASHAAWRRATRACAAEAGAPSRMMSFEPAIRQTQRHGPARSAASRRGSMRSAVQPE